MYNEQIEICIPTKCSNITLLLLYYSLILLIPLIGRAKENALNNPPCPITPTLISSSVHHSSHQLTTTFLSYYNVT